jgi:acid stress-induced BolA-like protein IbaG/YrbA
MEKKIMHLIGYKPQFHLEGWQAQPHIRFLFNPSLHHSQHQINIAGKKTPVRQIVTPQTPHVMMRRSARQQNLSQDMMAETKNQAIHCFTISAQTKYTREPSANTDVIILP